MTVREQGSIGGALREENYAGPEWVSSASTHGQGPKLGRSRSEKGGEACRVERRRRPKFGEEHRLGGWGARGRDPFHKEDGGSSVEPAELLATADMDILVASTRPIHDDIGGGCSPAGFDHPRKPGLASSRAASAVE
jgi:hypothetical protein